MLRQVEDAEIYGVLDNWFGERVGPNLYQRISGMPSDQMKILADAYLDGVAEINDKQSKHDSSAPSGELFEPKPDLAEKDGQGLRPLWRTNYRIENGWLPSLEDSRMKNLLTVSNQVVVDARLDPYCRALSTDYDRVVERGGSIRRMTDIIHPIHGMRTRLAELAYIRPFVEQGSIHVFDHDDVAPIDQLRLDGDLSRRIYEAGGDDLETAIQLREALMQYDAGNGSLLFRNGDEQAMFASLNSLTTPAEHEPRLSSLLWLDLPGLDELAVAEIYALRQSSDAYNEWRSTLARELVIVGTLRDQGHSAATARDYLSDALTPTVERLDKELQGGSLGARVRKAGTSLSITGVGSMAGMAAGGSPASSITSAATVALVNLAVEYFRGRRQARSDKALLGHLVALTSAHAR